MKAWASFNDQLSTLRSRGMVISNDRQAKHILARFGYYRLSGYWYPFRDRNQDGSLSDQFTANTHLSEIVDLYIFDKRLRLLALDALERIELALQVDIAHTLGELDPVAHTRASFMNQRYVQDGSFQKWSNTFQKLKHRSRQQPFVEHNLQTYGDLPIWVAIEIFDFGTLSHLFKLMRRRERDKIAGKYGLPAGNILEQWLKSLTYIRNVSAHHGRLWNNNIKDSAAVPRQFQYLFQTRQYRLFRYLCMMQFLLERICPRSNWKARLRDHLLSFPDPQNGKVSLDDLGIVEGWENWRLWRPGNEN